MTPGHVLHDRHNGVASMTLQHGSGTSAFMHLSDGCRTLTLPRRSNPAAATQSEISLTIFVVYQHFYLLYHALQYYGLP